MHKMKTLYLVSTCEYSDGETLGIFSTREKAQELIDAHNSDQNNYLTAYLEEYQLDESYLSRIGKYLVKVQLNRDFSVHILTLSKITNAAEAYDVYLGPPFWNFHLKRFSTYFLLSESDEVLALKIASDKFRQLIAEKGI